MLIRPAAADLMETLAPGLALLIIIVSVIVFTMTIRRQTRVLARRSSSQCLFCGYDLRESPECCPECGSPQINLPIESLDSKKLLNDWPEAAIKPRPEARHEALVTLFETNNRGLVNLLLEQLEARGIWCKMENRFESVLSGYQTREVAISMLLVSHKDEKAARKMLEIFQRVDKEVS